MRQRRLLLAVSALTFGCAKTKEPEPKRSNPKGSFYDARMAPAEDAAVVAVDAEVLPLPGNPKGSLYDAGIAPTPPPADAAIKKPKDPKK